MTIDLDGTGAQEIDSGIGFLDHMISALSKHARFDLKLKCKVRCTCRWVYHIATKLKRLPSLPVARLTSLMLVVARGVI